MRTFLAAAAIGLASAQKGRQTTAPVYTCPPQFTLVGKVCERQTTAAPSRFCQQGTLKEGQCLIPVARESECPYGTTPTASGCQTTETVPAEKYCPPNTHDIGGECQTYSVTGIVEICQRGALVGGQCELETEAPLIVTRSCPVGYEEAKGGCYKEAQMECAPPHQGKRLLQEVGKGGIMRPLLAAAAAAAAPPAPKYVPAPPAKVVVTAKQCKVKLEAPVHTTETCPPGMERAGQRCITKTFEPTSIDCSLGAPYLCFPSQTAPPNVRCPPGFQANGETCIKTINAPKSTYCPPGTIEGGSMCYRPTKPSLQCPTTTQLSGEVCVGKETTQPTVQVTVTCQGKNCYH